MTEKTKVHTGPGASACSQEWPLFTACVGLERSRGASPDTCASLLWRRGDSPPELLVSFSLAAC